MTTFVTETNAAAAQKILILGATGPTGRHIVGQALARGYDVTALVRSPEKATDPKGAKLVVGDARDEKALRQAIKAAMPSSARSAHRPALSRRSRCSRPPPKPLSTR